MKASLRLNLVYAFSKSREDFTFQLGLEQKPWVKELLGRFSKDNAMSNKSAKAHKKGWSWVQLSVLNLWFCHWNNWS